VQPPEIAHTIGDRQPLGIARGYLARYKRGLRYADGGDGRVQEHQDSLQFQSTRDGGGDSSRITSIRQETQRI